MMNQSHSPLALARIADADGPSGLIIPTVFYK
jgi:hypothetical protein